MSYKLRHKPWMPRYHALTIWECIGELSEKQRYGGGLHPPKAPAAQVNYWYTKAVEEANAAIEKMMQEE